MRRKIRRFVRYCVKTFREESEAIFIPICFIAIIYLMAILGAMVI